MTTDISFGVGGGYNISEGSTDYKIFKPALYFSVTPKYFYNLEKRKNLGKTVKYNSGNYVGLRLNYNRPLYKKSDIIRNSILSNLHLGIQIDGASEIQSLGLIDLYDIPPIDTWFYMTRTKESRLLFAWIPNQHVHYANEAVEVNCVDCINWFDVWHPKQFENIIKKTKPN